MDLLPIVRTISAFANRPSQRLLDVCWGPQAKPLRTQVAAMILDRKVTGSDKVAQWGNFRVLLLDTFGVVRGVKCIAAEDKEFQEKAMALLGVPVTSSDIAQRDAGLVQETPAEDSMKKVRTVADVNKDQAAEMEAAVGPIQETVPVAQVAPPDVKKTTFPLSRQDYLTKAPPLRVTIGGHEFIAGPREFSTKSLGYNLSGKFTAVVNGKVVTYQIGLNVTAVSSKDAQ